MITTTWPFQIRSKNLMSAPNSLSDFGGLDSQQDNPNPLRSNGLFIPKSWWEVKKAEKSLGVTGNSYPTAIKTSKRQFQNPNSVAAAYLNDTYNSSYVPSNDRQALRDYY